MTYFANRETSVTTSVKWTELQLFLCCLCQRSFIGLVVEAHSLLVWWVVCLASCSWFRIGSDVRHTSAPHDPQSGHPVVSLSHTPHSDKNRNLCAESMRRFVRAASQIWGSRLTFLRLCCRPSDNPSVAVLALPQWKLVVLISRCNPPLLWSLAL